jgi:hypothetical protein
MNPHVSRCFPLPKTRLNTSNDYPYTESNNGQRIEQWIATEGSYVKTWVLAHQVALAHLIPLLLCGEQSAQLVFNQEINLLFNTKKDDAESHEQSNNQTMIESLLAVEADEFRHDQALQLILNDLPVIKNKRRIQRQAQHFYTLLGHGESRCQHFIKIATLDSCVTQVMHEIEHSLLLGAEHPFARLCGLIKKDEAKHVYVAKHHAQALGATPAMFKQAQRLVSRLLHQLLATQAEHFDYLGVDLTKIFTTLEDKWQ